MSATDIPARHGPWISTGRRRHFSRTLAATFLLAGCWLAYPALAQPLPRGLEDVHLAMPLKELAVKRPEAAPLFKKLDLSKAVGGGPQRAGLRRSSKSWTCRRRTRRSTRCDGGVIQRGMKSLAHIILLARCSPSSFSTADFAKRKSRFSESRAHSNNTNLS